MYEFTYNASALGLGGVIEQGGRVTVIPSLASVALAPTGGEGSAVVENYSRDGISFSRAESRVVGYKTSGKVYTTISDIFITNLSVLGRLKVALLQGTVTSTRHLDADDSTFDLHAMYRGVEADGEELIPAVDVDLCSSSTYEDFAKRIESNVPEFAERFGVAPDALTDTLRRRREPIRGSLVSAMHRSDRSLVGRGNKLEIPGLGNVRFGELLVKRGRRRVNLLRFEFGRSSGDADGREAPEDFNGDLTVASGDGNGIPVWPNG
jgi:hypothetical protein